MGEEGREVGEEGREGRRERGKEKRWEIGRGREGGRMGR